MSVWSILVQLGTLTPEEEHRTPKTRCARGVALELTAGLAGPALSRWATPCPLTFLSRPHFPLKHAELSFL